MNKSSHAGEQKMDKIENEKCPMCQKNSLVLYETEQDIPFFGKVFIFGMNCSSCGYKQSDVEAEKQKEGCKYEFIVERDAADEEDVRKKAKNLLKKLWRVECGDEQLKIVLEDPSGNSAIISEKAVVTKIKGSKK